MRHHGGHEPQSLAVPPPNVGRLEFRDRPLTLCSPCGRVAPRLDEPDCMNTGDQKPTIRHRRSDTGAELRSNSATSLASLTESNTRAMRNRGDDRCGDNRTRETITSFLPAHRISRTLRPQSQACRPDLNAVSVDESTTSRTPVHQQKEARSQPLQWLMELS